MKELQRERRHKMKPTYAWGLKNKRSGRIYKMTYDTEMRARTIMAYVPTYKVIEVKIVEVKR